jgi:TIR domain
MAERRIFLSHAHSDLPFVQAVAEALRQQGLESWLDVEAVKPGEQMTETLANALRSASVVVAFLGDSSSSPQLNFEIGAALGQAKPIVPVFLSDLGRSEAPPQLRDANGIDASDLKPEEVAQGIAETLATAA